MRSIAAACLFAVTLAAPLSAQEAEIVPVPATAAPVAVVVEARALALHQYFYVDFPRRLQALHGKHQLANAEFDLIARRVESYRPFRSFGRYAATYTADLSWQVELVAAQHRLDCLRDEEAALWRERQLVAQQVAAGSTAFPTPLAR
jgi:hypothetical protein